MTDNQDNIVSLFFSDDPDKRRDVIKSITTQFASEGDDELRNKRIQKHLENKRKL